MKILSIVLGSVLLSISASAMAETGPLMIKNVSPGFAPIQYRMTSRCEIYSNKIVQTVCAASLCSNKTTPITIEGNLRDALAEAYDAEVKDSPAPTDGPITSYSITKEAQGDGAPMPQYRTIEASGSRILHSDSLAVLHSCVSWI